MPIDTIMIYRIGSLGDTIMALPVFNRIRELYPLNKIVLLSNKPVVSKAAAIELVLGVDYFFDVLLNYPNNTRNPIVLLKLILQIRKLKINKLFYLIRTTPKRLKRDLFFLKLAGVKKIIGIPCKKEDFELVIDPKTNLYEWEANRIARRLVEFGQFSLDNHKYWDLHFNNKEINIVNSIIASLPKENLNISLSLGTKMQSNDWGIDNWKLLIRLISNEYPKANFIFIGASEEKQLCDSLVKGINNYVINLCGLTAPRESALILKYSDVFIGHNSGPMHLSGAVGTPCVAIFSSRNLPGQWFPRGTNNEIIYHNVDCAGCYLEICIEQKKKCILSISITEVLEAVQRILN